MNWAHRIPELESTVSSLRISPEVDVPVTRRIKRIIDSSPFRRLSRISQLGLVSFVYPGATHTRQEHSLGVYRNAVHYVQQLKNDPVFAREISQEDAEAFLLAALLHDIGHWPYCHLIDDLQLECIPRHENLARTLLFDSELADILREDWRIDPDRIVSIIAPEKGSLSSASKSLAILTSMLSGPIDIDKLDYLERDSVHAGVPYGRNFDRGRLIKSLCIDPSTCRLAITEKGKTAAEMMVFARYVMFSEVYWHHTVRSATAMLQRAVYEMSKLDGIVPGRDGVSSDFQMHASSWLRMTESQVTDQWLSLSRNQPWADCMIGLFGDRRLLFKRISQLDYLTYPGLHRKLARRPYASIVALSKELALILGRASGLPLSDADVLIDAPSSKLEVQFDIDVRTSDGNFRTLGELSPMLHSLATKQFDDMVKRVRVFINPKWAGEFKQSAVDPIPHLESLVN